MTGVPHKGEYLNTTFPIMQALAPFLIQEVAAGSSSLSLACLFMVTYSQPVQSGKKSANIQVFPISAAAVYHSIYERFHVIAV